MFNCILLYSVGLCMSAVVIVGVRVCQRTGNVFCPDYDPSAGFRGVHRQVLSLALPQEELLLGSGRETAAGPASLSGRCVQGVHMCAAQLVLQQHYTTD